MSYRLVTRSHFSKTTTQRGMEQEATPLAVWRLKGLAVLRIAFGIVWAIDAWFKWQPTFTQNFTTYLTKAANGQSSFVTAWIHFWIVVVNVNPSFFAHLVASGETCIALGLLLGLFSNLTYAVGILLSFGIWSTAQAFGGPYGPGSTDIGVSIIYILVFVGLFLGEAGLIFGVDSLLARLPGSWVLLASGAKKKPQSISLSSISIQPVQPVPVSSVDYEPLLLHPSASHVSARQRAVTNSRLNSVRGQRLSRM